MHKIISIIFVLSTVSFVCDGYKILVVFPFAGRSHYILGEGIVRNLLEAGHEVTFITHFPKPNPPPNLKQINCSIENDPILKNNAILNVKMILDKTAPSANPLTFLGSLTELFVTIISHENVQKLFNDPTQKFDAVITEWMFTELYTVLGEYYQCPFIWFSSIDPHAFILSLIDEATNPAYVPNLISTIIPPFSFKERVVELLMQAGMSFIKNWYFFYSDVEQYTNVFKPLFDKTGRILPPYNDVKYNISLVIGNSHVSLGQAVTLPQSYKPIGGYHIDPKVKPLPEDLKKVVENSKKGVIYFSLGSNLKSKDMPEELKQSLLKMFGSLEYTIIWKFEDQLQNVPKNVHLVQWAPQTSILAHPKVLLFITHGGLLSTTETFHFGKPIIGIPVFADQFINVKRAVNKGFAKFVELSYGMADELKLAIEDILSDPKYANRAKELSMIYHDRPVPPGRELVHWVEHVVRTRGAAHLRSPALMVPWYQKMYMDFALLIVVILIFLRFTLKFLVSFLCKSTSTKTGQKKKKN